MTFKRLIIFLLLQWVALTVVKLIFYKYLQFDNAAVQFLWFAAVSGLIMAVLVRQLLGTINYLEAILVLVLVLVVNFFADALITINLFGVNIFAAWYTWLGYLADILAVFLFHKKFHVHVREEMHKHHTGHH